MRWATPGHEGTRTDRRSDGARIRVRLRGDYRRVDGETTGWSRCVSIDLSAGGSAIQCHGDPLEVGDVVLVRFHADGDLGLEAMQFRAEVRNARSDGRTYGVAWTRLSAEQHDQLLKRLIQLDNS